MEPGRKDEETWFISVLWALVATPRTFAFLSSLHLHWVLIEISTANRIAMSSYRQPSTQGYGYDSNPYYTQPSRGTGGLGSYSGIVPTAPTSNPWKRWPEGPGHHQGLYTGQSTAQTDVLLAKISTQLSRYVMTAVTAGTRLKSSLYAVYSPLKPSWGAG